MEIVYTWEVKEKPGVWKIGSTRSRNARSVKGYEPATRSQQFAA